MIKVHVLPENELVLFQVLGNFSVEDVQEALYFCTTNSQWASHFNFLNDGRKLKNPPPFSDFNRLHTAIKNSGINPDVRHAFITNDHFSHAVALVWKDHVKKYDMRFQPFRDLEKACSWLGVSPSKVIACLDKTARTRT